MVLLSSWGQVCETIAYSSTSSGFKKDVGNTGTAEKIICSRTQSKGRWQVTGRKRKAAKSFFKEHDGPFCGGDRASSPRLTAAGLETQEKSSDIKRADENTDTNTDTLCGMGAPG